MIFDLARDFSDALAAMPADHPRRRILALLEEALRRDIHFIDRHPTTLFQCMWNTCWWYDCPESLQYYSPSHISGPDFARPSFLKWLFGAIRGLLTGHRAGADRDNDGSPSSLLSHWRSAKETGMLSYPWLRAMRPPSLSLGSPQEAVFRCRFGAISHIAISPDGHFLASASGRAITVWDLEGGDEVASFQGGGKGPSLLAFAPDGASLVSYSTDKKVRVWDPYAAAELGCRSFPRLMHDLAFSPDGGALYLACSDGEIKVCNMPGIAQTTCLKAHELAVHVVAVSPSGDRVASGSEDRTIRLWDIRRREELTCLRGHEYTVEQICFFPDGSKLLSMARDGTVRVWDLGSHTELFCVRSSGENWFIDATVSDDGRYIAVGLRDGTIQMWDATQVQLLGTFRGHDSAVVKLAFTPDGLHLASGSADGTVRLWQAVGAEPAGSLFDHEEPIWRVTFSPSGRLVASGSYDGEVKIWDAGSGRLVRSRRPHEGSVTCLAFSSDGRYLASGSHDKTAVVSDISTGHVLARLAGPQGPVTALAFFADSQKLVTASYEQKHYRPPASLEQIFDHFESIYKGYRSVFRIWDLGQARQLNSFTGDERQVEWILISEDGREMVVDDGQSHQKWNVGKGRRLKRPKAFSSDTSDEPPKLGPTWHACTMGPETVIKSRFAECPVAWFPRRFSSVVAHPKAAIWAAAGGRHFCMLHLEIE